MIDLNFEPVTTEEWDVLDKLRGPIRVQPVAEMDKRIIFDWLVARLLAEAGWTAVPCGEEWVLVRMKELETCWGKPHHGYWYMHGGESIYELDATRFPSPLAALQAVKQEDSDA